jgi:hypothetical protein
LLIAGLIQHGIYRFIFFKSIRDANRIIHSHQIIQTAELHPIAIGLTAVDSFNDFHTLSYKLCGEVVAIKISIFILPEVLVWIFFTD